MMDFFRSVIAIKDFAYNIILFKTTSVLLLPSTISEAAVVTNAKTPTQIPGWYNRLTDYFCLPVPISKFKESM